MFDPSELKFFERTGMWYVHKSSELGMEIQVSDAGGEPDAASLAQVYVFLSEREVLLPRCLDYLEHHLKFEGTARLRSLEALARPNCHGASLTLVYLTEADRYMWLEVGLAPHVSHGFWPKYALVKYY
ncbi:MAG TPA: hypothetical protein VGJ82_07320 [Thermoanaerobaculia bacterium]